MDEKDKFALVRTPSSAVEKTSLAGTLILSTMVSDILAVVPVDLDVLVSEGKRIRRRQGMTPEDIRAFGLFFRAAVAGHGHAQLLVYECYLDGHGVQPDLAKALEWFHKSAESGFASAQCRLGDFYHGQQNYVVAVKWYRKAAEQGDAPAQCSLGNCYFAGEGVPQDYVEAAKWTRKAAEQGNAIAQKNFGVLYDEGRGIPQNYAEAIRWYSKAAEQGNAGAQYNLGVCYLTGQGVPEDYNEAVKWFRKAAGQGLVEAQDSLALCYEKITFAFSDFLASHVPLIGDCSLLPYPKKTIQYAIRSVMDDYETKREETTNQTLREGYDRIIPTLSFLFTRLVHDWQEIEQEDREAIANLSRFDSFPDWALPLKLKYLDDERASIERADVAIEVLTEKVARERRSAVDAAELMRSDQKF
jgi:TPR repeat protein